MPDVRTHSIVKIFNYKEGGMYLCEVSLFVAKGSSSQTDEEEFSGGAWAAMKAETGLDERNPSCFLHSYSVVMVLRKVISHYC